MTGEIMFMRESFQTGSLTKTSRKRGPDIWHFRWREQEPGGKIVRRKIAVGTVEQYPTRTAAKRAVGSRPKHQPAAQNVNASGPDDRERSSRTLRLERNWGKAALTKLRALWMFNREFLKYWIIPGWKALRLSEMKPVEVERWLHSLTLADGTKAKIRNIV